MRCLAPLALVPLALVLLAGCSAFLEDDAALDPKLDGASIHPVSFEMLDGEPRTFGDYAGRVVLVVNTASECGYTPQYSGLEALHQEFGESGLVVLGFPCNDFGGQEPGSALEIREFCSAEFDVTFPMAAKVQVEEGAGQSPVYAFLGGATGKLPGWNFGKYLIGKDGRPVAFYASNVDPHEADLVEAIERELAR